ncbi:hypothetical protein [Streptomyces misionensis]|uniref:hypothetical protein n=1 Tax=Streptomyces misionensis TaxID=67331 RepID=UPI003697287C
MPGVDVLTDGGDRIVYRRLLAEAHVGLALCPMAAQLMRFRSSAPSPGAVRNA